MNIKKRLFTEIRSLPSISLFLIMMILLLSQKPCIASTPSVTNVKIDKEVLIPGERIEISFSLSTDAMVTVCVFTPDHDVVRYLLKKQSRPLGINTVIWDGRDDSGAMVPNEAYIIGILAESADGTQVIYNPTDYSGGEISDVSIQNIEQSGTQYAITYAVPFASRISLRAGIHNGPLLKTLIDWQPVPAGEYTLSWDGMDETGHIPVMESVGAHLHFEGFALPKNSIIVQNSTSDYIEYRKGLSTDNTIFISPQDVRRSKIVRMDEDMSSQYLVQRSLNVSPVFKVFLENDTDTELAEKTDTIVSGEVNLVVMVEPESMDAFNESRYEIIVFVDNQRFDEEEHAHTPYTYTLDTQKVSNGLHLITINQASITGQIGTYSFKLNINN